VTTTASPTVATISGTLNLNALAIITVADGPASPDLDIAAAMTNGAVQKLGTGTLRYSGTQDNTYTGSTSVIDGTLELAKAGGAIAVTGGPLFVGDGFGGASA